MKGNRGRSHEGSHHHQRKKIAYSRQSNYIFNIGFKKIYKTTFGTLLVKFIQRLIPFPNQGEMIYAEIAIW